MGKYEVGRREMVKQHNPPLHYRRLRKKQRVSRYKIACVGAIIALTLLCVIVPGMRAKPTQEPVIIVTPATNPSVEFDTVGESGITTLQNEILGYPTELDFYVNSGELYSVEHLINWENQVRDYIEGDYVIDTEYEKYFNAVLRMIRDCYELLTYQSGDGETLPMALAKTVTAEIGGLTNATAYSTARMEEAAVVWCVLNRVDAKYEEGTPEQVTGCLKAPHQFAYRYYGDIHKGIEDLCIDVLIRWQLEHSGLLVDCGRVLPPSYKFFHGDGTHNHFRKEFESCEYWGWIYQDPYLE